MLPLKTTIYLYWWGNPYRYKFHFLVDSFKCCCYIHRFKLLGRSHFYRMAATMKEYALKQKKKIILLTHVFSDFVGFSFYFPNTILHLLLLPSFLMCLAPSFGAAACCFSRSSAALQESSTAWATMHVLKRCYSIASATYNCPKNKSELSKYAFKKIKISCSCVYKYLI